MKKASLIVMLVLGLLQCAPAQHTAAEHRLLADTTRIENMLRTITKTEKSRNYRNTDVLNAVADYLYGALTEYCDTVCFQSYQVNGVEYKNVIGSIGIDKAERIVIGAHYDVAGDQEGADDNASGIAGLLELSRLLSNEKLQHRIDFVAYSLEEPPYFRTESMGSYVHAKMLYDNQINIKGMICLEMIGYYSDAPGSQDYPLGLMRLFYGNKGDYITVIQKSGNGSFGRQTTRLMKQQGFIKTKSLRAPASLVGVDFSDHLNYWKYGYPAVMISNTAFYRNKNYHEITDKMETLDLRRMALVIDEVYETVKGIR